MPAELFITSACAAILILMAVAGLLRYAWLRLSSMWGAKVLIVACGALVAMNVPVWGYVLQPPTPAPAPLGPAPVVTVTEYMPPGVTGTLAPARTAAPPPPAPTGTTTPPRRARTAPAPTTSAPATNTPAPATPPPTVPPSNGTTPPTAPTSPAPKPEGTS